jgi:dolichol-phosphate mannosyltransferase
MRLLILICTYNERESLPILLQEIREQTEADILIVDDSSPDGTGEVVRQRQARDSAVHLLSREGKLGLGSAIVAGLQYGIREGYDWVLNLDADLSHSPAAIPKVLAATSTNDLVIGSRYVAGGGMENCSWKRHLVSRCANWYTRGLLGISAKDCSSAYRCYRVGALMSIDLEDIRCSGYGMLEEILYVYKRKNLRVGEVPIVYTERELGDSKISSKEAWGTAMAINRLFLERLVSLFRGG